MTLYSVYERSDEIAPAVVPETFSWAAAILPPVLTIAPPVTSTVPRVPEAPVLVAWLLPDHVGQSRAPPVLV